MADDGRWLLRGEGLTKSFGGIMALSRVDLSVARGEIVGLIGPNGAGKTTLFNLITKVIPPDRGRIYFDGQEITSLRTHQICRLGIARTFQELRPFGELSVLDNVVAGATFGGRPGGPRPAQEEAERLLAKVRLDDRLGRQARELSLAELRRLEIARALATGPRLLLLDEVMAGLNPAEIEEMLATIRSLKEEFGLTLLLIEHHVKAVARLCPRIIVLTYGRKIAEGPPEVAMQEAAVVEAYLGKRG